MKTIYRHTPEMGEISGFGGDYERACQDMLEAGCQWLERRKGAKLDGHEYENIYGIFEPDSDDAKELSAAVVATCDGCTGAMHHAVMVRLFFIHQHGWAAYEKELTEEAP